MNNTHHSAYSTQSLLNQNQYLFQLKPKRSFPSSKVLVYDFSPVKALTLQHQIKQYSVIPTFNHDVQFYSQTFLTHYDGLEPNQKLLKKHREKVRQMTKQITEDKIVSISIIKYLPKPRKHNHREPHCYVCKTNYSDYLSHVNTNSHKTQIKSSKFQKYIREIVPSIFAKQYHGCIDGKPKAKRQSLRIKALQQRK